MVWNVPDKIHSFILFVFVLTERIEGFNNENEIVGWFNFEYQLLYQHLVQLVHIIYYGFAYFRL